MIVLCSFETLSEAIYFKAFAEERELIWKLMLSPKGISPSCGYTAAIDTEDIPMLIWDMKKNDIECHSIYLYYGKNECAYKEIDDNSFAF
jgi:hypothetical protein